MKIYYNLDYDEYGTKNLTVLDETDVAEMSCDEEYLDYEEKFFTRYEFGKIITFDTYHFMKYGFYLVEDDGVSYLGESHEEITPNFENGFVVVISNNLLMAYY